MAAEGGWYRSPLLFAEAKGVAGLGKAGGDGQGGSDKAGQQVPPEVYMALTYAGTLFLFTLSVPLILYGLNKLLNKIEECFGCGASSKERKAKQSQRDTSNQNTTNGNHHQQRSLVTNQNNIGSANHGVLPPSNNMSRQLQNNQRLNLQLLQQHPKYTQFISMSSKQDFNMPYDSASPENVPDQQHPPFANDSHLNPCRKDQEVSSAPLATS